MEKLRFMAVLIIVIVLVSPQFIMLSEAQNTSILYPIRDSWIEAEYPNTNHGSETVLKVKADSRVRRVYLTFDLSGIPVGKVITSVKLYLYCTTVDSNPTVAINAHETQDSWTESTITWNNAPLVGAYITQTSVGVSGQYYSWAITSYGLAQYHGDKLLSIVVKLPQDDPSQNNPNYARDFASKEYTGTTCDPYLEVIYNDSPPVSSFTYLPSYPMANDTVTFNATASYDPDGNIVSYEWNFGDGNITTVTNPIVTHVYSTYGNYTVTLKVTDNFGLTDAHVEIVEVVDPAVLHVSLSEGTYVKQSVGDPWIDEGWLLYKTGNSWSFTVKIYDTSSHVKSYDTHVIVALSDGAYNNLLSLSINGTNIPKAAFKYGKPKPYGTKYWSACVYPAWFNDTYVNVGYIPPKGYKTLTVSVTFSDATGARMHFDAYGSTYNGKPCSWSQVTWSPNSEDSTVLYQAGPQPLSVSITPLSATIDLGQSVSFSSTISGGIPPYTCQWYMNNVAFPGATSPTWLFAPTTTGSYLVHLNVTDNTGTKAKSNVSPVTVNLAPSVSISPTSSAIKLGQSVLFSSTVTGGTPPYSYQWYVNDSAVFGATLSTWNFTPISTGYYVVFLKVTDNVLSTVVSNDAYVTVNLPTYLLTVRTNGLGTHVTNVYNGANLLGTATDTTPYTGWFVQGSVIWVDIDSPIVDGSTRFVFTQWSGDATGTSRPVSVTINANKTVTANYKTQYQITVTANPSGALGGTFKVTYTQCGITYTDMQKTTSWTEWVDASTTVAVTQPQDPIYASSTTRYKFNSYNPSASVFMDQAKTVTLAYKTQYYLTVSSSYDSPTPTSGWFDSGANITASVTSPVSSPTGTQYVCTGWSGTGSVPPSGSSSNVNFIINQPSNITWNWKIQYFLTVSSSYGTTGGQGWYDSGATAYASLNSGTFDHGNGTRRLFTQWGGDASGTNYAQSNQITMSAPKTALANWKTQYLLTVVTDPSGLTPQPTRNPAGEAGPANSWWYDASTSITLTAQSVTSYTFNRWDVDGSLKTVGDNPISVSMNTRHTATAHYTQVITYTLAITATAGGTTNPASGTYTYSGGATVNVAATPNAGYRFDHWVLNGSNVGSTNPISVLMDRNRSLQAVFAETHTLIISVSEGGTTNPAPGTYTYQTPTDVSVTATPNVGYRLDHWIYDNNNIGSQNSVIVHVGSSHTLRAVFAPASPSPVGGYSISLIKQTPVSHVTAYTMLIALFGVVLSLIKRKRK